MLAQAATAAEGKLPNASPKSPLHTAPKQGQPPSSRATQVGSPHKPSHPPLTRRRGPSFTPQQGHQHFQPPSSFSTPDAKQGHRHGGGLRGCSSPTKVARGHGWGGWAPAAQPQHLHFSGSIRLRATGWCGGSPPATPRPFSTSPSEGCDITEKLAGTVIITIGSR